MKAYLSIYFVAASLAIVPSLTRADDPADKKVEKTDSSKTVEQRGDGVKVQKDEHKDKVERTDGDHRVRVDGAEHREEHPDKKIIEEKDHRGVEHDNARAQTDEKKVKVEKESGDTKVEVTKKVEKQ